MELLELSFGLEHVGVPIKGGENAEFKGASEISLDLPKF